MDSEYIDYEWPKENKEQILPSFFESVIATPRSKILDIGCGTGWITSQLSESADYVLGIDNDPYMIERARRENARENIDYKLKEIGDIGDINDNFDLGVSTLAIQMLGSQKNLEKMLREIPVKKLIMVVPHPVTIDRKEPYLKYDFSEDFNYHNGGSYQVWLDNGKGGISFKSNHMPLKSYVNAVANSDFQINELKELGGNRFPYFLQLNLEKR